MKFAYVLFSLALAQPVEEVRSPLRHDLFKREPQDLVTKIVPRQREVVTSPDGTIQIVTNPDGTMEVIDLLKGKK